MLKVETGREPGRLGVETAPEPGLPNLGTGWELALRKARANSRPRPTQPKVFGILSYLKDDPSKPVPKRDIFDGFGCVQLRWPATDIQLPTEMAGDCASWIHTRFVLKTGEVPLCYPRLTYSGRPFSHPHREVRNGWANR